MVLLIELCPAFVIYDMLYFFVLVPIIGVILLGIAIVYAIRKKPKQCLMILLTLSIYCASSWLLSRYSFNVYDNTTIRDTERWLLHSRTYKAKVLAQPIPQDGTLRHMEWDGWGFPGSGNTVVYLVYDPQDSLRSANKNHSSGNFKGIPCNVEQVHRLESHWYAVVLWTDTDWNYCC